MNRLVATSASVGWTNTLFSFHSTLKDGLPVATRVTGSFTSITVKWFRAVCKCTMRRRSPASLSTRCARSGNAASTIDIKSIHLHFMVILSFAMLGVVRFTRARSSKFFVRHIMLAVPVWNPRCGSTDCFSFFADFASLPQLCSVVLQQIDEALPQIGRVAGTDFQFRTGICEIDRTQSQQVSGGCLGIGIGSDQPRIGLRFEKRSTPGRSILHARGDLAGSLQF